MKIRRARYLEAFQDPEGPIRADLVPYSEFFFEPIYQQMRQQLLAWRMEQANELGADAVRVVLVAPHGNLALWNSLPTPTWVELARQSQLGVADAFGAVLRRPERLVWLDSGSLVDPESPLSDEFKRRYTHLGEGPPVRRLKEPDGEDVEGALKNAQATLERVGGDGSVLRRLLGAGSIRLGQLDRTTRAELVANANELAELARLFRSGPLSEADDAMRLSSD